MKQKNKNEKNNNPFPKMEEEVLNFWDKAEIFKKSVEKEAPKGDYVFYDGPPFATGMPHYGHIVASIMKDAVPRYWTMKGYRVERKWGWDCHGLPVENLAEQELKLKDKTDIEKYGIQKFNDYCSSIVLRYAAEWKKIIKRIGRWVDMEDDYKTMDPDYMESIWWVFKSLWEKDLIYQGHKAMHICPRCGTTLSNFEVTLGYKDIKDISVVVKFQLEPGQKIGDFTTDENTYALAWTTTPWTLIGNVALAVKEKIDYQLLEIEKNEVNNIKLKAGDKIIIADGRNIEQNIFGGILQKQNANIPYSQMKFFVNFIRGNEGGRINFGSKKIISGKELTELNYEPLFDYYSNHPKIHGISPLQKEKGWKVYAADFVTTEEGTGIVHIAPAFGEDDLNLGKEHNLPWIQHVDGTGRFKKEVKDFVGMEVKPKDDHMKTDIKILKYLNNKSLIFSKEKYEHSYPHCWRCETPLLNYATKSWFVEVTKIRENLLKSNKSVHWVPGHIKDGRFGKWLEQARDWAISRNRYWGTPLPVWECNKCDDKKVVGSRAELEKLSGEKVEDLHKQFVDKITWKCAKCDGTMQRIPEVLDCWFESGSMPYAQENYLGKPLSDFDPEKNKKFPAQFIAEGLDQTRGWFYTLIVLSVALFKKSCFENVIVNGIVLAEDGQKMSKRLNNYPDPAELFEKYSVDAMRYYLLSSSVLLSENLNFSEQGVLEVLRKVEMLLWNVYKFYAMYADQKSEAGNQKQEVKSNNVLDQWILARLNQLTENTTEQMDAYNIPKAIRPFTEFINDFSTWYLRRSRDRFKGEDEQDKQTVLATTGYILKELSKAIAPFMPFMAEQIWQKVTGNDFKKENKSVHLESWPEAGKVDEKIIHKMEEARKIVELGLAARDEAGVRVRQPLGKLEVRSKKLESSYITLIKDEMNVKEIIFKGCGEELSVELDTKLTPELKQEGIKREMVRFINSMRKQAGLTIKDNILVYWETKDKEVKEAIVKNKSGLMKDTLTSKMNEGKNDNVDISKEVEVNGAKVWLGIKKK